MIIANKSSKNSAFSLIELMTAMTISVVIVGLLTATLAAAYNWSDSLQKNSTTRYDSKVGLDYFERDFTSLSLPEIGRNTFSLVSETVTDDGGNTVESVWIQMLSRPPSFDDSGSIRTVSYRVVNTDPLIPNGSDNKVSMFRSEVKPEPGASNNFLTADESLYDDYWKDEWDGYSNLDLGKQLLDDYLIENVAKFEVYLNYYDPQEPVTLIRTRVNDLNSNVVTLSEEGFVDASGVIVTPNIPVSVSLSVTTIARSAEPLLETRIGDWDEFLAREGVVLSRTFPLTISQ